ncbi:hypothetical protein J2S66_001052 [Saccharothrix longispora]|uniref:Uncharacterized protein n=1 Tax=Saccharothrix longispora TaxID=33920 RepID=A0ABU1PPV7_9PSEU|nr:hypothetical protein [Saccharothrix longispora]
MNASNEAWQLSKQLRTEADFRMLPLLTSDGRPLGLHFHRFAQPGVIEVVQAWDDRWAVYARLSDAPNKREPFTGSPLLNQFLGVFSDVVNRLAEAEGNSPR